jgi:hypothetical protein
LAGDGAGVDEEVTTEELAAIVEETATVDEEIEELLLDFSGVDKDFDVASVELARELDTLTALHFPVIFPLAATKSVEQRCFTVAILASFGVAVVCFSQPTSESCEE